MPRGSKDKYTAAQKRKAEHIEESYEAKGVPKDEAEARAWATVNKQSGGGEKAGGSGREKSASAKQQSRQASARRAAKTRQGVPRPDQPMTGMTRAELMDQARKRNIAGRSTMRKAELIEALKH
ncbi:Rho termination factor N-terminal domain-containing protein [Pseudomonas sp. zfem002]|uniref:Rho termination factor N-terminal domain-containing protein n=1 Tax=Pseudomonas sp. zfem002 TaxID=3078197 RepID=UPI00292A195A|nr:Rho termination factor N-terminal domain-containing protein [Pseudomonas sp. zfem002]MDU9394082.1 Rho termination factor N-terminal domain-containing protein [Pseudomonas sp. zfem002]